MPPASNESLKKYHFLEELALDNPSLAKQIKNTIPAWRSEINELFSHPTLADDLLNSIKYFSEKDTEIFCGKIAMEISEILSADSTKKVGLIVNDYTSESGNYFSKKVIEKLPKERQSNIEIISVKELYPEEAFGKIKNCFYVDDSSNSGEQLISLLRKLEEYQSYETKINNELHKIKIRLMAITEFARGKVNKTIQEQKGLLPNIDLKASHMPTFGEFIESYPNTKIQSKSTFEFDDQDEKNMKLEILGIFPHAIQDNLSRLLIDYTKVDLFSSKLIKNNLLEVTRTNRND